MPFGCVAAKSVWSECSSRIHKCVSGNTDFLTLFGVLSSRLEREELELFAMVAQRIWFRRNIYVFDGIFLPPSSLVKCAKEAIAEFREAHDSRFLFSIHNPIPLLTQWSKPPQGFIKLNWDAALNRDQKWIGVGIVSRDSNGKVIAHKCSYYRYISDPLVAEAFGAKLCAEFGMFIGFRSVILEGDAVGVVNALNRVDNYEGIVSNLIGETCLMLKNFDRWSVKHVGREGNKVAHSLAKLAVSNLQNQVWFGSFPSVLSELVTFEMYL